MGWKKSTLQKAFKKDFGFSLTAFINKELIKSVSRELAFSNLKVWEISEMYGFSSEFYFSRFFKKMTGYSPSLYRSQYLGLPYSPENVKTL